MNSELKAVLFYLTYVFTMDPDGKLVYCNDIWPYLIYAEAETFYNAEGASKFKVTGYLRIKTAFLTNIWGSDMYTTDSGTVTLSD